MNDQNLSIKESILFVCYFQRLLVRGCVFVWHVSFVLVRFVFVCQMGGLEGLKQE